MMMIIIIISITCVAIAKDDAKYKKEMRMEEWQSQIIG
jgi:hypothetical protein